MQDTLVFSHHLKGRVRTDAEPRIKIVGLGAAGTNIVGGLYKRNTPAELISINTDWTQLSAQRADTKLLIGLEEVHGHGCGGDAVKGKAAARESMHDIRPLFENTDMIFFVAGLGNGTATGGLPLIAEEARKKGVVAVAFLVLPLFMKKSQVEKCREVLRNLEGKVDTAFVLDHNKLMDVYKGMPLTDSFVVMNEVVGDAIDALFSLIYGNELIELDFANIKSALQNGGFGTIGLAETKGNVAELVHYALANKLFYFNPKDAKSAIVHVIGDDSMSLNTLNDVTSQLKNFTTDEADVVVGAKIDKSMNGSVRTMVLLTGLNEAKLHVGDTVRDVRGILGR